jgi:hypothetical protein
MATLTITKVSGVLFVRNSDRTNAKSYFGITGSYQFSDTDATVTINIGQDVYALAWQDLRVGTSTPTSASQAKTLLNAIFGT